MDRIMKYNHIGFIGFTIISEEKDPELLTIDELRSALLKRVIALDHSWKTKYSDWQDAVEFGESYKEGES